MEKEETPNHIVSASQQNPLEKIRQFLSGKIGDFKEFISQLKPPPKGADVEGITPRGGISERTKKVITIASAIFFIGIILLMVASYIKSRTEKPPENIGDGNGVETTIVERRPSRYATDSAVLKMESDTKALEEEIVRGDIEEKSLIPPSLNFDVNFKE